MEEVRLHRASWGMGLTSGRFLKNIRPDLIPGMKKGDVHDSDSSYFGPLSEPCGRILLKRRNQTRRRPGKGPGPGRPGDRRAAEIVPGRADGPAAMSIE